MLSEVARARTVQQLDAAGVRHGGARQAQHLEQAKSAQAGNARVADLGVAQIQHTQCGGKPRQRGQAVVADVPKVAQVKLAQRKLCAEAEPEMSKERKKRGKEIESEKIAAIGDKSAVQPFVCLFFLFFSVVRVMNCMAESPM